MFSENMENGSKEMRIFPQLEENEDQNAIS